MPDPPRFSSNDFFERNWGIDTAKYLINPGYVRSPTKTDAGDLMHVRPFLYNGSMLFIFPVGVEEFRASGDAQLGLYHYIGDNAVDGVVVHAEEGRLHLQARSLD